MRDLVIVGGGPVGLAAAIRARLAGLDAAVVEPRVGPIDKACGEGLFPGTLARVRSLGVDPVGAPLAGIRYVRGGTSVAHDWRAGPGLGVRRTALHAALLDRADAVGVERIRGRVVGVASGQASVRLVLADDAALDARFAIAADGLHSAVARVVGLAAPGGRRRRYGLRQHWAVAPWSTGVEVHYVPVGELYVTPVGDAEVGLSYLGRRGGTLDAAIEAAGLRERLVDARPTSELRGAGPFASRVVDAVRGRVLLVGDAAGYVDALTGEGIGIGIAQADAAVAAVLADDPARYARAWRTIGRSQRRLTRALATASDSPLHSAIVPASRMLPGVFRSAVEVLAQ